MPIPFCILQSLGTVISFDIFQTLWCMSEEHKAQRTPCVTVHVPAGNAGLIDAIFLSVNCNEDTQGAIKGDSDTRCYLDRENRRI